MKLPLQSSNIEVEKYHQSDNTKHSWSSKPQKSQTLFLTLEIYVISLEYKPIMKVDPKVLFRPVGIVKSWFRGRLEKMLTTINFNLKKLYKFIHRSRFPWNALETMSKFLLGQKFPPTLVESSKLGNLIHLKCWFFLNFHYFHFPKLEKLP